MQKQMHVSLGPSAILISKNEKLCSRFELNRQVNAWNLLSLWFIIIVDVYVIGSWTEEAPEATECAKSMDVGQAWWCICTTTKHRATQIKGVPSACNFPSQQT